MVQKEKERPEQGIDFSPQPIEPNYKKMGNDQKRICKDMANNGYIISVAMDHHYNTEDITMMDVSGDNYHRKLEKWFLDSLGKRGFFDQEVLYPSIQVTIVQFTLKEEVQKYFKTTN